MRFVPGEDIGVVFAVLSAWEVNADSTVRECLSAYLRSQIHIRVGIAQLIVVVGLAVQTVILGEIPFEGVYPAAYPHNIVAALVALDECTVVVYREESVSLLGIVPYTRIDDVFFAVHSLGNAYFLG